MIRKISICIFILYFSISCNPSESDRSILKGLGVMSDPEIIAFLKLTENGYIYYDGLVCGRTRLYLNPQDIGLGEEVGREMEQFTEDFNPKESKIDIISQGILRESIYLQFVDRNDKRGLFLTVRNPICSKKYTLIEYFLHTYDFKRTISIFVWLNEEDSIVNFHYEESFFLKSRRGNSRCN